MLLGLPFNLRRSVTLQQAEGPTPPARRWEFVAHGQAPPAVDSLISLTVAARAETDPIARSKTIRTKRGPPSTVLISDPAGLACIRDGLIEELTPGVRVNLHGARGNGPVRSTDGHRRHSR